MPRSLLPSLSRSKSSAFLRNVLARGERVAIVCEELAHGGPQSRCVWVTLLFCEFDGAVAYGRSVTTAVLSVASVWLVLCVCERGRERQASVSLEQSQSGRGPPPVLSTCQLHTNSGCGKERRILIGPW